MAKTVGLSQMAISRIWRALSLQPHRSETFKLSNDPQLVEKVRDIVGHLDPPDPVVGGVGLVLRRPDAELGPVRGS